MYILYGSFVHICSEKFSIKRTSLIYICLQATCCGYNNANDFIEDRPLLLSCYTMKEFVNGNRRYLPHAVS